MTTSSRRCTGTADGQARLPFWTRRLTSHWSSLQIFCWWFCYWYCCSIDLGSAQCNWWGNACWRDAPLDPWIPWSILELKSSWWTSYQWNAQGLPRAGACKSCWWETTGSILFIEFISALRFIRVVDGTQFQFYWSDWWVLILLPACQ